MENKCKKCGCEDPIPLAPCPTSVGCPTPSKCNETFNAECVVYTGENLVCDDNIIVATNDTIDTAIRSIIETTCAASMSKFDFDIVNDGTILAVANLVGAVAPVSYLWSIEQGTFTGHAITGGATAYNVVLDPIAGNTFQVGGISGTTGAVHMSHVKVRVTDGKGIEVTKYYVHAKAV